IWVTSIFHVPTILSLFFFDWLLFVLSQEKTVTDKMVNNQMKQFFFISIKIKSDWIILLYSSKVRHFLIKYKNFKRKNSETSHSTCRRLCEVSTRALLEVG